MDSMSLAYFFALNNDWGGRTFRDLDQAFRYSVRMAAMGDCSESQWLRYSMCVQDEMDYALYCMSTCNWVVESDNLSISQVNNLNLDRVLDWRGKDNCFKGYFNTFFYKYINAVELPKLRMIIQAHQGVPLEAAVDCYLTSLVYGVELRSNPAGVADYHTAQNATIERISSLEYIRSKIVTNIRLNNEKGLYEDIFYGMTFYAGTVYRGVHKALCSLFGIDSEEFRSLFYASLPGIIRDEGSVYLTGFYSGNGFVNTQRNAGLLFSADATQGKETGRSESRQISETSHDYCENHPALAKWKTGVGYTVLGIVLTGIAQIVVELFMVMLLPIEIATGCYVCYLGIFNSLGIWYALSAYPGLFGNKPLTTNPNTISLLNGLFGGIIFGPLWNRCLTKRKIGPSIAVAASLSIITIFMCVASLIFAATAYAASPLLRIDVDPGTGSGLVDEWTWRGTYETSEIARNAAVEALMDMGLSEDDSKNIFEDVLSQEPEELSIPYLGANNGAGSLDAKPVRFSFWYDNLHLCPRIRLNDGTPVPIEHSAFRETEFDFRGNVYSLKYTVYSYTNTVPPQPSEYHIGISKADPSDAS